MKFARLLLLLCLVVSLVAVAQEKKPAAGDKAKPAAADKKEAKPASGMPAAKPAPEIQKLAKMMVGSYTTKETFDASPMVPSGGTGTGEAKFTLGPGGHSIIESYQSKTGPMGANMRGHGLIWWDAKAGGYRGVWCDSMTPSCDAGGLTKWEGDKLVGTNENEMMGKKFKYHETMSGFGPQGFKFDMEMSSDGGPMKHAMTIEYTKAQGAAAKPSAEKEKKQ